ncbi:MAG TPA: acyl-CoA dehydrogenase [Acidimicrobiales bacterium]|nr:acyl-CoA dehydrogenase [Acidimicrobiales bacterium]
MDVRLSAEQQSLRAAAGRLVDRLGPRAVADLEDEARIGKLRDALAASGWADLRRVGDADAPLASGVEAALVAEELGRGLADVAFLGPVLAADLRRRAGLPDAEEPETVVLESRLGALAVLAGGTRAGVAVDAGEAGAALAFTGTSPAGRRLVRIPLQGDPPRASRTGPVQLDLTRPTLRVVAQDGAAPALDGGRPLTDDDLAAVAALGLALTCADLVGVMRGAVALARDYAVNRRQYDAPIGSFQAVQHLLADAHVATEGSCSVALHAAWAVDALAPPDALAAAALAKAYCARAARTVCETAVQVHGGIGNTWDCLAHVYLRRALLSSELFGDAEVNVERVLAHCGVQSGVGSGHGLR